ncbi:hypothetical protein NGM10_11565 [Halorussus salilacus]|uniref:HVO_A0556 family zinc finger protein n=1 Tax=Halorussus salilacus TaxID=2953750 RepID=UPI00209ED552|nr:HVO_A0556 family zinc finger protein [Halorussus salilacus]USZ67367.1 hypothetical protein NGM10_11565 [Halorussus salilacus]
MQGTSRGTRTDSLLAALVGDDCNWCARGTLARGEFKGDDAVVCEECDTPAARVW